MSTIAERVAKGAAFLDARDPGWWRAGVERAIDLDRLYLASVKDCVLGQRCPVEILAGARAAADEEDEYLIGRYDAYAAELFGMDWGGTDLAEMAHSHGFAMIAAPDGGFDVLTAEWTRVITERRSAS